MEYCKTLSVQQNKFSRSFKSKIKGSYTSTNGTKNAKKKSQNSGQSVLPLRKE